ncbi:hypothetical protein POM88_019139 [Heracleum sosnowskyi]|uniref:Uncharacterized protein n=1 Tax=Heracleum sosnowskyi TaxID=360622 RepID=A0AAD8MZV6_9APIA|nr:hypothetical protein POM88_019139 [Heracleum sosnowskyi]
MFILTLLFLQCLGKEKFHTTPEFTQFQNGSRRKYSCESRATINHKTGFSQTASQFDLEPIVSTSSINLPGKLGKLTTLKKEAVQQRETTQKIALQALRDV